MCTLETQLASIKYQAVAITTLGMILQELVKPGSLSKEDMEEQINEILSVQETLSEELLSLKNSLNHPMLIR